MLDEMSELPHGMKRRGRTLLFLGQMHGSMGTSGLVSMGDGVWGGWKDSEGFWVMIPLLFLHLGMALWHTL